MSHLISKPACHSDRSVPPCPGVSTPISSLLQLLPGAFPERAFIWGRAQTLKWQYVQQEAQMGMINTAGRQALSLRPVAGNLAFHFLDSQIWWKWLHLLVLSCLSAYLVLAWIFLTLEKYWSFKEQILWLFLSVKKDRIAEWESSILVSSFVEMLQCWWRPEGRCSHLLQRWLETCGSVSLSLTDTVFKIHCPAPGV